MTDEFRDIPGMRPYQISPTGRIRRVNKDTDLRRTPRSHEVQTTALLMVGGKRRHVVVRDLLRAAYPEERS